ncbi:MAG: PEP-CTERM sorting domain-containing protein [Verrucomicrobiota bacterium]|nr:PEP-CTERM sorting domain-containing protein [Verrucomicrobiota bacterium]
MNTTTSIIALFASSILAYGQVIINTTAVGIYDALPNATDIGTGTSTQVNTLAAGSNLSLEQFSADVFTAFNNNQGGVVDFEGTEWTNNLPAQSPNLIGAFNVSYGIDASKTITFSGTATSAAWTATGNAQGLLSGAKGLGSNTLTGHNNGQYTFTPSLPIESFGITVLSRNAARTITAKFTLDDASVITFPGEAIGLTLDHTLFAYKAPIGKLITDIQINDAVVSNFLRMDDMAFVVPEPSTYALIMASICALLALVRNRNKR